MAGKQVSTECPPPRPSGPLPRPLRDPRLLQLNVSASARLQQVIRQERVTGRAPTGVHVQSGVCRCRGEGPAQGREAEWKGSRERCDEMCHTGPVPRLPA